MDSVLKLQGKKATILLDADLGGIWITPKGSFGRANSICLYIGDGNRPYVGIYGGDEPATPTACDAALSADSHSQGRIQGRNADGKVLSASIADLIEALVTRQSAVPETQETLS